MPLVSQGRAIGRVQLAGHKLLGGKVIHEMLQSSGAAANRGPPPHTDWVVSPYTYIHHEAGDGSPHQHWRYRTEYKRSAEDETRERWEWSPGGFVLNWQGEGAPPSGVVGTIKAHKNESMAVTSEGSSEEKWTGQDTWEWHHYTWRLFRKFQGNKMWVERYEVTRKNCLSCQTPCTPPQIRCVRRAPPCGRVRTKRLICLYLIHNLEAIRLLSLTRDPPPLLAVVQ